MLVFLIKNAQNLKRFFFAVKVILLSHTVISLKKASITAKKLTCHKQRYKCKQEKKHVSNIILYAFIYDNQLFATKK